MFPEGTFHWEAQTLSGQTLTREIARKSAEQLDPKTLASFKMCCRGLFLNGILSVERGIDMTGLGLAGSDFVVSRPSRFSRIAVIKRKRFPLQMSDDVQEIYVLKLTEGDEQIVVLIEPRGVRIAREEPVLEVI
jgi:hypothetical protein